jgi:hypothetical protein
MRISLAHFILALSVCPSLMQAQVYLLAGTPASACDCGVYGASLFEVTGKGVQRVSEMVPPVAPPGTGLVWVGFSYEKRKAVIEGANIQVLDLNTATVVKSCTWPQPGLASQPWLADVPGRGLTLEGLLVPGKGLPSDVGGMILDSSTPCRESFTSVQPFELRYLSAHGTAGTANIVAQEGTYGFIAEGGRIWAHGLADLGVKIPPEFTMGRTTADIIVNDPQVLIVLLGDYSGQPRVALAFRKSDNTWHVIPAMSELYARFRSFGGFVAITETRAKATVSEQLARGKGVDLSSAAVRKAEQSAGRVEWRGGESPYGPDMAEAFETSHVLYPGRLHLYEISTEKLYTITTNQADSEVLFVEGKIVYYRASDRLYTAPIGDRSIGRATLVATDEVIRDAHWAFIKH